MSLQKTVGEYLKDIASEKKLNEVVLPPELSSQVVTPENAKAIADGIDQIRLGLVKQVEEKLGTTTQLLKNPVTYILRNPDSVADEIKTRVQAEIDSIKLLDELANSLPVY